MKQRRTSSEQFELISDIYKLMHTHIPEWGFSVIDHTGQDIEIGYVRNEFIALTNHEKKSIFIAEDVFSECTVSEVISVIVHEIAHALASNHENCHNDEWRVKCIELGGNGEDRFIKCFMQIEGQLLKTINGISDIEYSNYRKDLLAFIF